MRPLVRVVLIVTAVLLVAAAPLLIFGHRIDAAVTAWLDRDVPPAVAAVLVAGMLAVDIVLPIPSSAVSTYGGAELGVLTGTAASWLGMTAGAAIGFWLARAWGRPMAERLANEADLDRVAALADRYGPLVLVLSRGLPLLAEAAVLLFGLTRLTCWRFFWPVALANLGLAAAYSAFGALARHYNAVPYAVAASIAVPMIVAIITRRRLRRGVSNAPE